jgi:2-polyprenyl-6-hydroxyphenyl methylase/3-demethylubiquinone-9 3-methyltransferase
MRVPFRSSNEERISSGTREARRQVHAAGVQHAPAEMRQRGAGAVAQTGNDSRRRHRPRVGGVDPVHVGVDLARRGSEGGRERDRGRVGAAAAERGDLLGPRVHALESRHDHHPALLELGADAIRPHFHDACRAVRAVGQDAALRTGERDRLYPQVVERHGEQRHADALAGGEQHVQLAAARSRRDRGREAQQLVGGLAHRRHHHDHIHAAAPRGRHALGHGADPFRTVDRRASVLVHEHRHGRSYRALAGAVHVG